jgi:DNA repair protein RadC
VAESDQVSRAAREDTPHYHGHRERLRERFRKSGLDGFAEHEIVELLLTLAVPRCDVKVPAKALLARFGSLRAILDAPTAELEDVAGIGLVAATALKVVRASACLYLQQSAETRRALSTLEALAPFWRLRLGALGHEVFEVCYLDGEHRLLRDGVETLQVGTTDRAAVYPRRVAEGALRREAAAVVLAHNHTVGSAQPSEHDRLVTRAVVLACEAIQVEVYDHLIVAPDAVFSFREEGLL